MSTQKPNTKNATANETTAGDDQALRPERIGGELRPERIGERLRPERIGLMAEELPAWRLTEDEALLRTWSFPSAGTAAGFAHFVATFADAVGRAPTVRQYRNRVTVRLSTPRLGGLTDADFELARALGPAE